MFTILLSILFSTNVLAASTPINTAPWSNLKSDKSLTRFQSTLLNHTMLTFLNQCYPPQLSSTKWRIPCSRYFDAILQLNNTNFVVQQPTIEKLLNEPSTDTDFCNRKHEFPAMVNYETIAKNLSDPQVCGYMCLGEKDDGTFVAEPICVFLAWMGEQIKNCSDVGTVAVSLAPAISSTNTTHVESKMTNKTSAQELPSAAAPPPDVLAGKPEIPNVPHASSNQSKVIAQTVVKEEPSLVQNQDAVNHKANVAAAVAAAEAMAPELKEEKLKPLQIPKSNPDTQEEETLIKDPPINIDKHDSLAIDQQLNEDQANENDSEADPNEEVNPEENDDENDDFDIVQQKLKSKDPLLASPDENAADQKTSQESIEPNYVPNTNHVTDPFLEESGSNFFEYFLFGMFLCIVLYVVYHNKSKILALLLEGRRSDKGRSGRRKHTAAYRKLDSNLEEAMTSSAGGRITQIIY